MLESSPSGHVGLPISPYTTHHMPTAPTAKAVSVTPVLLLMPYVRQRHRYINWIALASRVKIRFVLRLDLRSNVDRLHPYYYLKRDSRRSTVKEFHLATLHCLLRGI